jgi:RNA polymerase sigma-70 factor (ECF subfamily)
LGATSTTLLGRVATLPPDKEAWDRFVERYGPSIARWCLGRGMQDADAQDVTQSVLTTLVVRLPRFVYDPSRSFRGFLQKITRDAVSDALAQLAKTRGTGGSDALRKLEEQEASEELARKLEAVFDLELLEIAEQNVRQRVEPRTWEAYWLAAHGGLSGAETAARVGMRVGAVFEAKSSVMDKIRNEIRRLEDESFPPSAPGTP